MAHIPKVVCINGNGIGQYCNVPRIPRKGETALPTNLRYVEDSGKGVNCAIVIGRLGGDVAYIGKVGDDDGGHLNEKWLKEANVNIDHFWYDKNIKTSLGLVLIADNGENLIFNFDSPGIDLTEEEALPHLRDLKGAEYLITGFEQDKDVALKCAEEGCALGMKVFLNPSPIEPTDVLPALPFVDTLAVNEPEALILLNRVGDKSVTDWEDIARQICEKYRVNNTIITLGGDGAAAWYGGKGYRVPGIKVDLVDESGAGDAYLAVVVQCLIWGKDIAESLDYANKYCAYVVSTPGDNGVIGKYLPIEKMDEVLAKFA